MVRKLIGKIQKHFFNEVAECVAPTMVSDDVKEGHFAVLAMKGSEKTRFVVKIEFLNDPSFRRLLERAEQEYGFEQTGTLVVPCTPKELKKIVMP